MISIIVAISQNYAIGKNGDLLWHISEDLKFFKRKTSAHTVIMGRKTFESLPVKPLPNRRNIVLSSQADFVADGCEVARTLEEALAKVSAAEEAFVIGGGKVYEQAMNFAENLYVTWVFADFAADVFFPRIDEEVWKTEEKSEVFEDEKSGLKYAFFKYVKK